MKEKTIVISLGGSLIVPDKIDIGFLKKFKKLIESQIRRGKRFIIICGGGKTARRYQAAARALVRLTDQDVDWLGIGGTKLNAQLLRTIFYRQAHPRVIKNPQDKLNFKEKILIAAGWKPGCSTDYDAVLLAKNFKAETIINLSNIDYVFDKDPSKFKNAKPLKKVSWRNFRKLIPRTWHPGLNSPFDPVASRYAQKLKLKVIIINGKKLNNLTDYLGGKKFVGTEITG